MIRAYRALYDEEGNVMDPREQLRLHLLMDWEMCFEDAIAISGCADAIYRRNNQKKLTPRDVRAIRSMSRRGVTQAKIAEEFGVNPATVSRIVGGVYH